MSLWLDNPFLGNDTLARPFNSGGNECNLTPAGKLVPPAHCGGGEHHHQKAGGNAFEMPTSQTSELYFCKPHLLIRCPTEHQVSAMALYAQRGGLADLSPDAIERKY